MSRDRARIVWWVQRGYLLSGYRKVSPFGEFAPEDMERARREGEFFWGASPHVVGGSRISRLVLLAIARLRWRSTRRLPFEVEDLDG
jgi:hypothetical protein